MRARSHSGARTRLITQESPTTPVDALAVDSPVVTWERAGVSESAAWWTTNDRPVPKRTIAVDDRLTADEAVKHAAQGVAMLWLGDFHNAKQLLSAIDRRVAKGGKRAVSKTSGAHEGSGSTETDAQEFYRLRQGRAQRSRMMSLILVPLEFDAASNLMQLPLSRAPQVGAAVEFGYGPRSADGPDRAVVSLQELTGVLSAHQWYLNGVEVPSLGAKIHPRYGTFLPTRHEYVDLVAQAPLADPERAFDIGTGTGILAAVLVNRGVPDVVGTDIHRRAVDGANETFARLGIADRARAELTSMFPEGRAQLIVCNPPWLPGSASTSLDAAVYDPGSKMLLQFLSGLPKHLAEGGEGWLLLSDLAELLGLRSREMLLNAIETAGLEVIDRIDTVPTHRKSRDVSDVLHEARSREVTSLWRLRVAREQ